MREIILRRGLKGMSRMFKLFGVILGEIIAFIIHPMGMTNAQSIDCPEGKFLATGNVCVTNGKDIVLQATATEDNQTLKINKYFTNTYNVDRGDGSTGNLETDTTHTYDTAGIYEIILSLSGLDRRKFGGGIKALVPKAGTTVTGVKIIYMPSLAEGFGDSATAPGNYFFHYFNNAGALTSLPEGSFDTSNITTAGVNFFTQFNKEGLLTTLPEGSFNTINISGRVEEGFFWNFNRRGNLTILPEGSFKIDNITVAGNNFFFTFNTSGSIEALPEGSFNTSNITEVGDRFFCNFNEVGKITSLPEGSFDISNITKVGDSFFKGFNNNGKITSLPEGSFDTSNISGVVGSRFFAGFNNEGKIASLPEGSFDTSNITMVSDEFFYYFNNNGKITSLPTGSFNISNITSVGSGFFCAFNSQGMIASLPEGSFDTSNITVVGDSFFAYFNVIGKIASLPEGSFRLSTGLNIVSNDFFFEFNTWGELLSLPEGSFNTNNITTVGNNFLQYFNYGGKITSLPEGSFDMSNITAAGNNFFSYFNYDGRLVSLPDSFKISSVGVSAVNGYKGAFRSTYMLNKNVSDLVSGVIVPLDDRDTFSDNQPGRCGVDENWLENPAEHCSIITISFYDEGALVELTGYEGSIVDFPEDPNKTGYTFDGWYESGASERFDINTGITSDIMLYAVWKINEYTITFVDGEGINGDITRTGEYGSIIDVNYPEWTRNGYTITRDKEIPETVPANNIVITAIWRVNPRPSSGGGGSSIRKDNCPDGDYTESYYDGKCGKRPSTSSGTNVKDKTGHNSAEDIEYDISKYNPKYSDEMNQAYQYAYHYGITTKNNIKDASMNGKLTRVAMAKMLSQYAINVLGMKTDTSRQNKFADVTDNLDIKYSNGVTLAYQLGIMGINMPNNEFRPYNYVTRAEFATALSRLLYRTSDGEYEKTSKYYVPHINKLTYEGILTNTDPTMKELRGYVMLMLMRSAK